MKVEAKVNVDAAAILKSRGLGESKAAQKYLVQLIANLCDPYVPFSGGAGAHMKAQKHLTDSSIIYKGPYAHYQYVGEVMAGRAPKHYTGKSINYSNDTGKRGKAWDKRMMADRREEVEKGMDSFLAEGGKIL